jgi:chemotaxis protein MotA
VTQPRKPRRPRGPRLDLLAIVLAPLGVLVVLAAHVIDGSSLAALADAPSAMVVIGGTLGAVLVSFTPSEIAAAGRAALATFRVHETDVDAMAATLVTLSIRAQRRGLPALETETEFIADPLLRNGLSAVVDGATPEQLDQLVGIEVKAQENDEDTPVRIFEAAAGYAPTMGILGAVLGLMRVMEHINAPGMLGSGIALAFVATVYGVGLANLVLLPIAGRLRERSYARGRRREMIVQGLHALQQRANPRLVAQRLRAYSDRIPKIEDLATQAAVRPMRAAGRPV